MKLNSVPCGACGESTSKWLFDAGDYIYGNPGQWPYARCNSCGVVFMNPRISPNEIGQFYPKTYYTNELAGSSSKKPTFRNKVKQVLLSTRLGYPQVPPNGIPKAVANVLGPVLMKTPPMRRQIHWVENGRVLDVGCGNGDVLDQYRALGWRTTGVEPGPESAQLARERGHSVITGLVEEIGLPSESFDAITLWDALEHIPNPAAVLSELYRLLAPQGKIYIHVPNYGSIYARLWQDRWFMFTAPLHYFHYSKATLKSLLERTGFSEIDISTGLGEVGWRQSLLSGAPENSLRRRLLSCSVVNRISNSVEQGLPDGHLTAVARKRKQTNSDK